MWKPIALKNFVTSLITLINILAEMLKFMGIPMNWYTFQNKITCMYYLNIG